MNTWQGSVPQTCDICEKKLHNSFIDGKTQFGPWAMMCVSCHRANGGKLGLGIGQKYVLNSILNVWEKIQG
jgi:cytochrome c553